MNEKLIILLERRLNNDLSPEEDKEFDKLLKEDPKLALKHPSLLRQIKVASNVLQEQPAPGSTLINVDAAKFFMKSGKQIKQDPDDPEVIEGEVEED